MSTQHLKNIYTTTSKQYLTSKQELWMRPDWETIHASLGPGLHMTPYRYCTVQYCTVLYCTVQYCTALYCTVL